MHQDPFSHPNRRNFIATSLGASIASAASLTAVEKEAKPALHFPKSARYNKLNKPFNSDLKFTPAAIAACSDEQSVTDAVNYARENKLKVSIKSGGHAFTGSSFNNDGLIIDVSGLRQKIYRAKDRTFTAGAGLKLEEVTQYLLAQGRLLPAGSCSSVGLSGLTLGGGYGFFARQHGLTCDHLQRVRMVNARGKIIDSKDDPDLLWACRGGGNGNFGVITSMQFSTVEAPKKFTTQKFRAYKLSSERATSLMKRWFEIAKTLPNPIFSAFILNGNQITILISTPYSANGPAFKKAKNALLKAGTKTRGVYSKATATALKVYSGAQHPLPFRNMSAGYYNGFQDIEKVASEICKTCIDNRGIIFQVNTLGGAIDSDISSAYPHRSYGFLGELQAYWQSPKQRAELMPAVDKIRTLLKDIPHHYANYPDPDLAHPGKAYYGEVLEKLQTLKKKYDPEGFFGGIL